MKIAQAFVRFAPCVSLVLSLAVSVISPWIGKAAEADASPQEIFERRIVPIFNSPNPSSCTECHLAGVDLKNYILPSHEKTFISLRDQGLIDLDDPKASKILRLISMGSEQKRGASLINDTIRQKEYEAFSNWIVASTRDPKLRNAPKLEQAALAKPARPNEVIRHARKDRLLESFENNIWAQRFRCMGCHMPGGSEYTKLVAEHGDKVSWMKEDAKATMENLMAGEFIDIGQPDRSRLLRKPLNEIKHGGGQKMLRGDLGYKAFRAWLEDYAKVVKDEYASASDLPVRKPGPDCYPTEIWFKVIDTPAAWDDRLLQVSVFAWDIQRNGWEPEPIAISDRRVWGKGKLWQHNLLLMAPPGSQRAEIWKRTKASLPSGRYLVKVHVDFKDRLESEWQSPLGSADFAGEATVESTWPAGYNRMTTIKAGQVALR